MSSLDEHPELDVPESWRPAPTTRRAADLPATTRDRMKNKLLGKRLLNEDLAHERLGRPTALAVFSSDALSSTAYATEEILKTLFAAGVGVAAFAKVTPITIAMVVVLAILLFSYRQTIKAYPSAGGAYIVTKDNLGLLPAQVAGVALLTDYVLTVAVSVSAGVSALYSAIPGTYSYRVPIALVFIVLISWGNLRGVKESGRLFAAPTYGFILSVMTIIVIGFVKRITGHLHHVPAADPALLLGNKSIGVFLILHAFASGGAAMTGVEAISNGVPAFRKPEWKNARSTLMVMGTLLGIMFLGLSWLGSSMHVVPTEKKTVISQIAKGVLGGGAPFFIVQLMTLLILVLAANTSFADFPRLASFHAEDAFMPRQLTKRGHRLAFSNGIVFLAVSAAFLVVLFQADVTHLIPLYAIGVFTSFTLSQAGMAKRHIRIKEEGWRLGLLINGGGAVATGVVTIVIGVTKFAHGAWAIMLLVPLLVATLVRLNHQYESEKHELTVDSGGVTTLVQAPVPARHYSLVLIDQLDGAAARGLHVARTLRTDRTEAVHFATDEHRAEKLAHAWAQLGVDGLDLRMVDCPDRRIDLKAQAFVGELVADGRTQVSVLIPRLMHKRSWHRLLHDRTSETLALALSKLPHVNVTFVPFQLGGGMDPAIHPVTLAEVLPPASDESTMLNEAPATNGHTPIRALEWRRPAFVHGKVTEMAVQTVRGVQSLAAVIDDGTGCIDLLFLGRSEVAGVQLGSRISASGMAANHRGRLTIISPTYEFEAPNEEARH